MTGSMIRYSMVAGICLLTHNVVMIASDHAGASLLTAVVLSYAIVVVIGFVLHTRFTFASEISQKGFIRYAAAMLLNIPLAWITTALWHDVVGLAMLYAAPLATAMMVTFNYFASRWATAKHVPLTRSLS